MRTKEEKGLGGELAPLERKKTKAGQILQSFTAYHDAEESRKDGKAGFAGGEGDGEFFWRLVEEKRNVRVVGVDLELRFSTRGWLPKFITPSILNYKAFQET